MSPQRLNPLHIESADLDFIVSGPEFYSLAHVRALTADWFPLAAKKGDVVDVDLICCKRGMRIAKLGIDLSELAVLLRSDQAYLRSLEYNPIGTRVESAAFQA